MPSVKRNRFYYLLAAFLLLAFLLVISGLGPFERTVGWVFNPVLTRTQFLGTEITSDISGRLDKKDLMSTIDNLETEVTRLKVENAKLKTVEEENKLLREGLRFFNENENKYVMANVVARGSIGDVLSRTKGSKLRRWFR